MLKRLPYFGKCMQPAFFQNVGTRGRPDKYLKPYKLLGLACGTDSR